MTLLNEKNKCKKGSGIPVVQSLRHSNAIRGFQKTFFSFEMRLFTFGFSYLFAYSLYSMGLNMLCTRF